MKKLILPNFKETVLSNRIISSKEDIREFFNIERCNVQVFIFGYKSGHVADTHTHEEIRLTVIRSGRMKFSLDNNIMELGSGDFITILPNVPHGFEAIGEQSLNIVEFVVS